MAVPTQGGVSPLSSTCDCPTDTCDFTGPGCKYDDQHHRGLLSCGDAPVPQAVSKAFIRRHRLGIPGYDRVSQSARSTAMAERTIDFNQVLFR